MSYYDLHIHMVIIADGVCLLFTNTLQVVTVVREETPHHLVLIVRSTTPPFSISFAPAALSLPSLRGEPVWAPLTPFLENSLPLVAEDAMSPSGI